MVSGKKSHGILITNTMRIITHKFDHLQEQGGFFSASSDSVSVEHIGHLLADTRGTLSGVRDNTTDPRFIHRLLRFCAAPIRGDMCPELRSEVLSLLDGREQPDQEKIA